MERNAQTMIRKTKSSGETFSLGETMGERAESGEVYALDGDLGVGKTVFAKGFARGLGIKEHITSPTFTILQEYEDGRLPLYHFDVYRVDDPAEMEEIGFDDYLYGRGVCLIEWAERIDELLPAETVRIRIRKDDSLECDDRTIEIEGRQAVEL